VSLTHLLDDSPSEIQFTGVGFKFGPITNPGIVGNSTITIIVEDRFAGISKVYAKDTTTITVAQREVDQCPEDCNSCTVEGKCTSCKQPSERPILNSEGRCESSCPAGFFLEGNECFKCAGEC